MKLPHPVVPMQFEGLAGDLKYLAVTVLIIAVAAAGHNLTITEDQAREFAMCEVTIGCQGMEVGDYCIGVDEQHISCIDPRNASEYRRAEAECALDAQGICNANPSLTGMEWTEHPNATYDGRTCSQWGEDDERVDLLPCEDTSNDITQWTGQ